MKKTTIILTLIAIFLATTASAVWCEDVLSPGKSCNMTTPVIQCTNYTYEILNQTSIVRTGSLTLINSSIYYLTFNQSAGDYVVRLCDNSTREIYVKGEDNMGSLAITVFILSITAFFTLLPFLVTFSKQNEILNFILKRCCWVLASVLMAFNSGIMAILADYAGIPVEREMFRFMWLFGWGGYLLAVYLVINTFFKAIKMWQFWKKENAWRIE